MKGFGTRAWVRGLLENPTSPEYFGTVKKFGGMKEWKDGSGLESADLDKVADFVATFASIPEGVTPIDWLKSGEVAEASGPRILCRRNAETCHAIEGLSKGGMRKAPQLFGWGSPWWIARMIRSPRSSDKYGFLDEKLPGQMPAFGEDQITSGDVEMLIRYLKGDYAKPAPAAAAH